jgi:uncharacterized protein (TIGR01244 family)
VASLGRRPVTSSIATLDPAFAYTVTVQAVRDYRAVADARQFEVSKRFNFTRRMTLSEDLELSGIYNFRRLSENLITSGQPSEEQLAGVANAGFKLVVNLALRHDEHSLPDERGTVESLGMAYEHIPVIWQQPTRADLDTFFATLDRHAGEPTYVHCAANFRVSSFILLYRVLRLSWRLEDALPDLEALWQPNDTWQAFIDEALGSER